jgi:hypothetical protein
MNPPRQSSLDLLVDVLHALTSASWRNVEIIADFIRREPKDEEYLRHLFLLAICCIRDDAEFSNHLALLAEHSITAACELSIAGAHLSLCSQFLCIRQADKASREALAFGRYAIAAAHSVGLALSDFEQEMVLERASSMPALIESQQSLSIAKTLGHIPRRMLFVLGVHRSGTSALAGMLRDIGLDAPKDLMPPTDDNPKGYFESIGIMKENNRLLTALGTSWKLDKPLPRGWIDKDSASKWRQALLLRLQESFSGAAFPVIKDPRFCVLLAGLSCWLQADIVDYRFVLLVRHPLESVKSLMGRLRNPITKDFSLRLWIESVLSAERITRGMQRMVVIADDLFESPADVQSKLHSFIQSDSLKSSCEEFSSFVDPELRHHRFSDNMLGQPVLGINQCEVLEDLAIMIYDEIKDNQDTRSRKKLDELYNLWILTN